LHRLDIIAHGKEDPHPVGGNAPVDLGREFRGATVFGVHPVEGDLDPVGPVGKAFHAEITDRSDAGHHQYKKAATYAAADEPFLARAGHINLPCLNSGCRSALLA
jgi:hypothetical protein